MRITAILTIALSFWGSPSMSAVPIPAPHIDLAKYMGSWYVISSIPSRLEKDAWNAVETYALEPDGSIRTTFTYNKGALDGPLHTMHAKGVVKDKATNAVWGM